MSYEYARRQLAIKKSIIKKKDEIINPLTDKEEWEDEFDNETMYEKPFL